MIIDYLFPITEEDLILENEFIKFSELIENLRSLCEKVKQDMFERAKSDPEYAKIYSEIHGLETFV